MVAVGFVLLGFVELEGLLDPAAVLFSQNAAVIDHPAQAAGRVGTAAEPEQKNLVAGLVVVHQKPVAVHHVLLQPVTGGAGPK